MRNEAIALAAAVLLAGCAVKAPKVLLVPPAPAPKADPPALIYPQTALELPDPQPVPPEAIPKREPPPQPAVSEVSPARTPPRRTPSPTPAKREPEAESASPPADAVKPAASRTPLVPVDPALPRSDIIQKRLDALRGMHDRLASKTGGNAEMIRSRIEYFVLQAANALARNDLRQADSLASRAEVLAQDLLRVR